MSQRWRKWYPPSLKYLKSIIVRFDPLDPNITGTREFYFQACNNRLARTNPKCVVRHELYHDHSPPWVEFVYTNDKVHRLITADKTVDEITLEMVLHTAHLRNTTGMGVEEEMNEEEDDYELKNN